RARSRGLHPPAHPPSRKDCRPLRPPVLLPHREHGRLGHLPRHHHPRKDPDHPQRHRHRAVHPTRRHRFDPPRAEHPRRAHHRHHRPPHGPHAPAHPPPPLRAPHT